MNEKATRTQICRGCMKVGGLLLSMYNDDLNDKKLPNKLADLASIEVDENDGMPNVLCPKCAYRTDAFYDFRLQVQESDKKLRKMFSKFSMNSSFSDLLNDLTDEKLVGNKCRSTYNCIDKQLSYVFNDVNCGSGRMDKSLDDDMAIGRFGECGNGVNKEECDQLLTPYPSEFNTVESESIGIVDSEVSNKYNDGIESTPMEYIFLYDSPDIKSCNLSNETIDKGNCHIDENNEPEKIEVKQERTESYIDNDINSNEKNINDESHEIVNNLMPKKENVETEEEELHIGSEITLNTVETTEQFSETNECAETLETTLESDIDPQDEINIEETDMTGNDFSDDDSDDYMDPKDNILGSLNDTVVRLREIKLEDGSVQHQCTICMQNYSELSGILVHTVDNHVPSTGPFYCIICEKDCNSHKELRSHVKTHVGPNPYTCFICEKGYATKRYLKRHIAIHTDFPRHRCFKCGKRFKVKNDLKNHMKTHIQSTPYACSQCPRTFNYKSNYRRHLISHIDPCGVRLPKFPCRICGKRFLNNRTLEAHSRVHTGEKPFTCDICGRTFTQEGNLKNHLRIHSNPRSFTCEVCGKRFNQRSTLRDHSLLHTGEKPYICTVCGEAFTVGAALRRHMFKHTDNKPYGCEYCKARFIGKYDLTRHMKTHNGKPRRTKFRWMHEVFDEKDAVNESDNDINFPMISINELDEPDVIVTPVSPVSEQRMYIEQVLASSNGMQMMTPQRESEKENVDALFNLMQYD